LFASGAGSLHREAIKNRSMGVPVDWPREAEEKSDQNEKLSERSEFFSFRFFLSIAGIGQSSGSPFLWLLAFGEAKESDCPAA
jgi:hypothetical protein